MTWHTVDGRNPAPADIVNIPLFTGCYTSQVVSRISEPPTVWWLIYITFVESLRIYILYMCPNGLLNVKFRTKKPSIIAYRLQKTYRACFFNPQKSQTIGFYQTSFLFSMFVSLFSLKRQTRRPKCPKPTNCSKERLGVDITIKFIIIVWMNPMEIQSLGMVGGLETDRNFEATKKSQEGGV